MSRQHLQLKQYEDKHCQVNLLADQDMRQVACYIRGFEEGNKEKRLR